MKIRVATVEDAKDLLKIYGYYVENTAITYEYEVPSVEEFQNRICQITKKYPYLIAEDETGILGYAYASAYHERPAYGWNVEMTIYLNPDRRGNKIGQVLYTKLEEILTEQGFVNLIALITPPGINADEKVYNSMHFHEKMGYLLAGRIKNSGYKFHRWYDTITMTKQIREVDEHMGATKWFDEVGEQFCL